MHSTNYFINLNMRFMMNITFKIQTTLVTDENPKDFSTLREDMALHTDYLFICFTELYKDPMGLSQGRFYHLEPWAQNDVGPTSIIILHRLQWCKSRKENKGCGYFHLLSNRNELHRQWDTQVFFLTVRVGPENFGKTI